VGLVSGVSYDVRGWAVGRYRRTGAAADGAGGRGAGSHAGRAAVRRALPLSLPLSPLTRGRNTYIANCLAPLVQKTLSVSRPHTHQVGPEDDGVWPVDPVVDAADAEQLMRQLSDCLLEPTGTGLKCALLQSLMTPTSTSPRASLYMGVLHAVPPNPQVRLLLLTLLTCPPFPCC
jgi:hypothetical protein